MTVKERVIRTEPMLLTEDRKLNLTMEFLNGLTGRKDSHITFLNSSEKLIIRFYANKAKYE